MTAVALSPIDLALAASLVLLDAGVSIALKLNLHRQVLWAAARMVVQLIIVGYLLRFIFTLNNPAATLIIVLVMAAIAAREIAARPERKFKGLGGLMISTPGVVLATFVTAGLALATAIRPHPWFDPRYAIPLAGIILGSVLNAGSLTLDSLIGGVQREAHSDRGAAWSRRGVSHRDRRASAKFRSAGSPADHQPDVGRRSHHPSWHHDRADHCRHGPGGSSQISNPPDVPPRRGERRHRALNRLSRLATSKRWAPAPAA